MAANKVEMSRSLVEKFLTAYIEAAAEKKEAERELDARIKDTEEMGMEYIIASGDPDPPWEEEEMRRKFGRHGRSPSPR